MLDESLLGQVREIFSGLSSEITLVSAIDPAHESAAELAEMLDQIASCSPRMTHTRQAAAAGQLQFSLSREGKPTGVTFRGIPGGHEFSSLLLAILNADGKGKNLPDEGVRRRIAALAGPISVTTYVSLTCTNCPDVVQAMNVMALCGDNVSHEMVDGALFQQEADAMRVQAVPTVYANGQLLHVGRGTLGELLQKLEEKFGSKQEAAAEPVEREYDLVVIGAGPAGSSAAIYSARKGLKVAVVAERMGGQVNETVGIENLISVPQTTGAKLADALRSHMGAYPIDIYENRKVLSASLDGHMKSVTVAGGETFTAPAVIIATGASWRKLNVEGEDEYIGCGVAFCPHCDGPFYSGKRVAVVGGGNSGIEAAIDLAGICSEVTVFEFLDTLKADEVLQQKAASLPNVTIVTSAQTTQVVGDGQKVTAIRVKDRGTGQERDYELDGIFVQIGLMANSAPFRKALEVTRIGEIKIDERCRASLPGVYAAGDVSSVPYKQIIIAMGEGAKAALTAFDDRIRK